MNIFELPIKEAEKLLDETMRKMPKEDLIKFLNEHGVINMWAPFCENFDMTITKEEIKEYEARQKKRKNKKKFKVNVLDLAKFTVKGFNKIMKIEELETELQDIREKANKIEKEIEELKKSEKKGKRWKPERGEIYYIVDSYNDVRDCMNNNEELGNRHYSRCNCFKTKEKAKEHAKNVETKMLLQKYADEHNEEEIDWENKNQIKWYMSLCYSRNEFNYASIYDYKLPDQIYFTSKEIVENAIKEIGEDRIIKYLKEM